MTTIVVGEKMNIGRRLEEDVVLPDGQVVRVTGLLAVEYRRKPELTIEHVKKMLCEKGRYPRPEAG